ncbi:20390_t:CDS:2 [Funneliformis geosporum]|nr:20390_t:CDS:2 [Funneliformis geosporum]
MRRRSSIGSCSIGQKTKSHLLCPNPNCHPPMFITKRKIKVYTNQSIAVKGGSQRA